MSTQFDDSPDFALAISATRDGRQATLVLDGEVGMCETPEFRRTVRALQACGTTDLVIDCSAVTFMDSSGISVLAELVAGVGQAGGSVTINEPSPTLQRLFAVTGLDTLLQVTPATP